ncbi:NADH-quinone oxidoreductase subunit J [Actinospica durhamensis]|uniref:NADH-quinone oxidoreductase subunit J n=1 Tax=Actinospica durhamensis TaxID=1508375 RepID=A0A941EQR6_9ACTN|nr:NADH-quinone oxidoreductase subunit J [Actinospica durhamensis]MBR7832054.1 NADH-quinone oxidoreductase subunit J [Actinospica durhamensis]
MATHSYLSPTGVEIAFVLVGLVVLGSGLLVVTLKNLVHAALWLIVCMGGIGIEYLLLGAEMVAWIQVLIYGGAVIVLFLFGLMLTKAPIGRTEELDVAHRWPAVLVGLGAAGTLVTVTVQAYQHTWFEPRDALALGSSEGLGTALFHYWVLPFEALSVLLLAALVGAIALSRARREDDGPDELPGEAQA